MDNYILLYWQGIQDGTYTVGKWIWLFYKYIVDGLENQRFFFDAKKADKAIRFIEMFCHHCKGRNDLLKLEVWQKAALSVIFGVVGADGLRWFTEVVIVIGRKNGKSLFAAAIIACVLILDREYGAEIYCVAPKLDQADIVYSAFVHTVNLEPELGAIMYPRKTDYFMPSTNSFVKKIAFNEKKADGYNPQLTVCDEIASWPGQKGLRQYEVMTSGGGSRDQPLTLAISTSGYENEGIYDELINRSTRMLMGGSREEGLAPLLYMVDDLSKWNDIQELKKANPNYGVSLKPKYLARQIKIAEDSLSKKAEFITKFWLKNIAIDARGNRLFGALTDEEQRAFTLLTSNAEAVVPTAIMNRIVELVESDSPIYDDSTKSSMVSGFSIPRHKSITAGDAKKVDEGAANDDEQDEFDSIDLPGFEIKKHIVMSRKMQFQSIEAFETWLVTHLAARIRVAKEKYLIQQLEDPTKGIEAGNPGAFAKAG